MSGVVFADDYEDGVATYEKKDYETAFSMFRRAAEQGNASAQINLENLESEMTREQVAEARQSVRDLNPIAPRLGEHNREILTELGYDEVTIDALRNSKVIGATPER